MGKHLKIKNNGGRKMAVKHLVKEILISNSFFVMNKKIVKKFDADTALLLSSFAEAEIAFSDDNGWFFQTIETVEEMTGLQRKKQERCIKKLIENGILEQKNIGMPRKRYFRLNYEKINEIVFESNIKSKNSVWTDGTNKNVRNGQAIMNKTDNYKEINKENNNKNTYIVENEENLTEKEQIPYKEIIEYLNEKADKQYRYTTPKTRELIKARWNEGFTLDDFKKVIDNKTLEWKNTKWENYLRPVTLFSTKFESYLNDDPNIILRKKKEESKKEEYNIQEFFDDLEIDYIIELTGNEYMAKKRFNEYAEKYGVDKDSQMLFKEFRSWCRKLRDGEKV